MSRPLRHAPPVANRRMILRPRLLSLLRGRFDRRLTAVVAPPGFGKTTLLSQAVAENALSPLGEDRWLTCQRDDMALSFLAGGAYTAVGLSQPPSEDPHVAAVAVAEAMWSAAPSSVALFLDDAHLVGGDSPGSRFLVELVSELPDNGHVVLASRPPLPVSAARLVASGEAAILDGRDLQFRDDELDSFADLRGVPTELLGEVGGWPALAELTASVGPHAVVGYVWEELLTRLSPERRHALAVLVAVGGVDDEIAAELLGRDVNLERLLDGLPLVVRAPTGWWSLHGLWASALQHHLDAGQVADLRRRAAAVLRRRRQYHEAMDLLFDAAAWPDVRDLVVEVCGVFAPLVPADVLERWLARMPPETRRTPEGLLLAAMVLEPTGPQRAEQLLQGAIATAPDRAAVRYACLNALLLLAFWRSDRNQMVVLLERLEELVGEGHAEAPALIALVRALLARGADRARAELAVPALMSGAPLSPMAHWLHAHIVLLKLGDPAAAEPLARRALVRPVPTLRAASRCQLLESFRLRGRLDEAEGLLPDLLSELTPAKVFTSPELLTCAVVLLTVLGRDVEVGELLEALRPTIGTAPVAWAPVALQVAEAFHAVSIGQEQRAVAALRTVAGHGLVRSGTATQVSAAALPLLYVLAPQTRDVWDATAPPGCFADAHRAARVLVDLRENGSLAAVGELPQDACTTLRTMLPIPWAATLALAMVATGRPDGRALLVDLGQAARSTLRTYSRSDVAPLAAAARKLLREIPATPAYRLRLRVLGPLELRRDGVLVTASELRRERVRQLIGHLLLHGQTSRSTVTAELWPDLDETAASRNLRVTLAYLQNVLEPDRAEQDAPFFVRSVGSQLVLVTDRALEVDAREFDRYVDEATQLERQGAPSAALVAYERAVGLWGGDYLADIPETVDLRLERDRLRGRLVKTAVRAGQLLLARGDRDGARALAERALHTDEWSEPAYQLLVAADLAAGDFVSAQRSLRRCHAMLRELGLPADRTTVALGQRLHASH